MAVVATDCFHDFIQLNHLSDLKFDELSDDYIGHAFQNADIPAELLGDLRALSDQVKTPLAIRSSSLLEDALDRPFAGVYATKMIPNNQLDPARQVHQVHQCGDRACLLSKRRADAGRPDQFASRSDGRRDCRLRDAHSPMRVKRDRSSGEIYYSASTFFSHTLSAMIAGSSQRSLSATSWYDSR